MQRRKWNRKESCYDNRLKTEDYSGNRNYWVKGTIRPENVWKVYLSSTKSFPVNTQNTKYVTQYFGGCIPCGSSFQMCKHEKLIYGLPISLEFVLADSFKKYYIVRTS